mmetsp:Transcript_35943/g.89729  ORF Transcript_35943/g.89729 Transcript_35943/m.89729 type:complete len:247 (-) Transcript_35943:1392-2132(-)
MRVGARATQRRTIAVPPAPHETTRAHRSAQLHGSALRLREDLVRVVARGGRAGAPAGRIEQRAAAQRAELALRCHPQLARDRARQPPRGHLQQPTPAAARLRRCVALVAEQRGDGAACLPRVVAHVVHARARVLGVREDHLVRGKQRVDQVECQRVGAEPGLSRRHFVDVELWSVARDEGLKERQDLLDLLHLLVKVLLGRLLEGSERALELPSRDGKEDDPLLLEPAEYVGLLRDHPNAPEHSEG